MLDRYKSLTGTCHGKWTPTELPLPFPSTHFSAILLTHFTLFGGFPQASPWSMAAKSIFYVFEQATRLFSMSELSPPLFFQTSMVKTTISPPPATQINYKLRACWYSNAAPLAFKFNDLARYSWISLTELLFLMLLLLLEIGAALFTTRKWVYMRRTLA